MREQRRHAEIARHGYGLLTLSVISKFISINLNVTSKIFQLESEQLEELYVSECSPEYRMYRNMLIILAIKYAIFIHVERVLI